MPHTTSDLDSIAQQIHFSDRVNAVFRYGCNCKNRNAQLGAVRLFGAAIPLYCNQTSAAAGRAEDKAEASFGLLVDGVPGAPVLT